MRLPSSLLRLVAPTLRDRILFRLVDTSEAVALTFDDGPDDNGTPRILDELARRGYKATFFCQGSAALRMPQLVRRVHEEGHLLASHGMEHLSARRQGAAEALRNALSCHEVLEQITGHALPRLYRPPYGDLTFGLFSGLRKSGFLTVMWDRDSLDSFVSSAEDLVAQFAASPIRMGNIVLFHDDYAHTAAALPELLANITDRSLQPVRVDSVVATIERSRS